MVEKVKITGTAITCDIAGDHRRDAEFEVEFPLRDLFAAFALNAVVRLNIEEATHESDAAYAYAAADAMMEARALTAREGME